MAIYPPPMSVLIPALVINVALAAHGAWRRRNPVERPGLRVPIAAILTFVLMAAAAWTWFPDWDRRFPVVLGIGLGALLGLKWEWALPPADEDKGAIGPLAGGLGALAFLGLILAPGVPFANASLGLVAAWGVLQFLAMTMPVTGRLALNSGGPGLALSAIGLTAGAAAWGARLQSHGGAPVSSMLPLAIALGTLATLGVAVAELAGPGRARFVGSAIAGVIFAAGGIALAGGIYQQPPMLLGALAVGAAAGIFAGSWLPREGPVPELTALVFMGVVGTVLVVENRMMGIMAIGLGGLGLVVGAAGRREQRALVAVAVAIFAARVWLQLFLDRTNLTGYGVDLTHPYAFAALIFGGLVPSTAVAIARLCRPVPSLAVGWALVLAALPAWLGFLIHVEALGGLLSGLVLAAFIASIPRSASVEHDGVNALAVVPALLLMMLAVTMLASPWLVNHMNAPRDERVYWFLASTVLGLLAIGRWWLASRRRQVA